MSLADEMRIVSNSASDNNVYVSKHFEQAKRLIREAASKGDRYLCFYDFCHPLDVGYSKSNEQMLITKLKEHGFHIKEKWRIFGGNQITPYVVW